MYRVNSRVLLAGFLVAKGAYAQGHAEPVVAA